MTAFLIDSRETKRLSEFAEAAAPLDHSIDSPEFAARCTIDAIHAQAETVTPILKEILDLRPPLHWGINE